MKNIICFTILLLTFTSITFSQSVLNYQTGTGVVVEPGADICADQVIINGTFSGGGTICGATAFVLNLNAFIQGFYRTASHTMVADTITVYLRSAVLPYSKVDSAKSVLSTSGTASLLFLNAVNGTNYYIVIKHRNSIETWSLSAVAFASGTLTYDFTPLSSKAFGSNQIQVDAAPVRFGIYSGDVNQDGSVDLTDITLVYNAANSFVTGYVVTDVNGDNITDLTDLIITYNNSANFVEVKKPM